tara:strand:+ start:2593 stop:3246 length:654 start_codon:yes stop_codon:yes gene_type:complete
MKVLVFDTETTGLPINKPEISDVNKWPHVIQLSHILYDTDNDIIIDCHDDIIKLDDKINISVESIKIHGITRSQSKRKGIDICHALDKFNEIFLKADIIVAHNISFDIKMIMVELLRNNKQQIYFNLQGYDMKKYCTMKNSVNICKILKTRNNGNTYYKFPRLSELHTKLFKTHPNGTHDSMADVLICLRCYCKIVNNNDVIKKCNSLKKLYDMYCS